MQIKHFVNNLSCAKNVVGDKAFFLQNKLGDTLHLFNTSQTRYEGWHLKTGVFDQPYLKLLDRINFLDSKGLVIKVVGINNRLESVDWELEDGNIISMAISPSHHSLSINALSKVKMEVILDVRNIYQQPKFDRNYAVSTLENQNVLVEYSSPLHSSNIYLAFAQKGKMNELNEDWFENYYPRDEVRNSGPNSLYLYNLGAFDTTCLKIGYGESPAEALNNITPKNIAQNVETINRKTPNYTPRHLLNSIQVAQITVNRALSWLYTENGIYAGLPWFHQVWSRDELIAGLGLPAEKQLEIIQKYLNTQTENGEFPTYIGSGTFCADGLGWFCLLLREYGLNNLDKITQNRVALLLQIACIQLNQKRKSPQGLIYSGHNATWMDTIGREGFRIEIQCMYALCLEILYTLTGNHNLERERLKQLGVIKQTYFVQGTLADGAGDPTIRPNVFIAYLLQPDLLSAALWEKSFQTALSALRCDWGGLSSINMRDPLYQPVSTGENNLSYHNGDSWFFVNNMAGIAMQRLNPKEFNHDIMGIVESSTHEILFEHMVGMPGEIASAKKMDSFGCGIQAFSGGTYLALIKELDYSNEHSVESIEAFWDNTALSTSSNLRK